MIKDIVLRIVDGSHPFKIPIINQTTHFLKHLVKNILLQNGEGCMEYMAAQFHIALKEGGALKDPYVLQLLQKKIKPSKSSHPSVLCS